MPRRCARGGLCLLLTAVPWLLAANTPSADWPQFRGPHRDDISADKGLLKEWPKDGPPLAWKVSGLGAGFSSVSVAGDRIFTMGDLNSADAGNSSYLFALDRKTGTKLWSAKVGKTGGNYQGTRSTPTVDGDLVYGLGQWGDLVCVKAADGKEVWRKSFKDDFKGQHGAWQFAESVLVDGNKLVCTPGGKEATMVALDKKTGDVLWKCAVPKNGSAAGYSSIVISEAGGVRQYVQLMANGVVGVEAKDGKFLWIYDKLGHNTANIPTCIVHGDYIFCSAGYGKGGALLKIARGDNGLTVKEEYYNPKLRNRHGGVVMVGDYIYGDVDQNGFPWCAKWKTGEIVWQKKQRGPGSDSAAITYADGRLYIRYQNGYVALVDASPDGGYKELGGFKIPDVRNPSWSHPVVVGGKLYLREQDRLYCYDVKAQ